MSLIGNFLLDELPREKLEKYGASNLTDVELLAIILRTGTKEKNVLELSREILETFSFEIISRKSFDDLLRFKGVQKVKASQIVCVFELARRFSLKKEVGNNKVSFLNSEDIFNFVRIEFLHLKVERVMIIFVDIKNNFLKKEVIHEGSVNFSLVEPRKIIRRVFDLEASGFILLHNHPSGDCSPSLEDINVTKKLKGICDDIGIRFLDHIIVGDEFYSFFDNDRL